MAPRTKEQQIAYNAKRRAENAAKKAPTNMELKAMEKAMNKASVAELDKAQRKPEPARQAEDAAHAAKAALTNAVKTTKDMAKSANGKAGAAVRKATKGMPKTVAQKLKGKHKTAKPIKGVDTHDRVKPDTTRGAGHERLAGKAPKHDIKAQVKALGPDSLLPEPKQNARVVNPTMHAAYVRNGKPGAGMLRGKNYQATVTFTPEQFMELKDRAAFWNRSLAEQIRYCCVNQMKS